MALAQTSLTLHAKFNSVTAYPSKPQLSDEAGQALNYLNDQYDPQNTAKITEALSYLTSKSSSQTHREQVILLNRLLYPRSQLRFGYGYNREKYTSSDQAGNDFVVVLINHMTHAQLVFFPQGKPQDDCQVEVLNQGSTNPLPSSQPPLLSKQESTISLSDLLDQLPIDFESSCPVMPLPPTPTGHEAHPFPLAVFNQPKLAPKEVERLQTEGINKAMLSSSPSNLKNLFLEAMPKQSSNQIATIEASIPSHKHITMLLNSLDFLSFLYAVYENELAKTDHSMTEINSGLFTTSCWKGNWSCLQTMQTAKKTDLNLRQNVLDYRLKWLSHLIHQPDSSFSSDNDTNFKLMISEWKTKCLRSGHITADILTKADSIKTNALLKQKLLNQENRSVSSAAHRFMEQQIRRSPRASPYSSAHASPSQSRSPSPTAYSYYSHMSS